MTNPNRLYARLEKLAPEITKSVRRVLAAEAERIVRLMKAACPEDTGALRESIGWSFGRAPRGRVALGAVRLQNVQSRVTIYAGSQVAYYVRHIEFGSSRNRAQPFFWPTWRSQRKRAKSQLVSAANQGIRAAIK